MAVRIRLKKMGRRHLPYYRIDAFDSRSPRDGKSLENLGHYNPREADEEKKVTINQERLEYWTSNGAQLSEAVASLLKKKGIVTKKKKAKKKTSKKE